MAVVFKSKSQYLALLVAFWGRRVSVAFDCNMIFDCNGNPHGLKPKAPSLLPFHLRLSNYCFTWASSGQGFHQLFPNPEDLDVLLRML